MNKEKFIKELERVTGLDNSKCVTINSIVEAHFIIGKNNKKKMILDMMEQLNITEDEADLIYEDVMAILVDGVKNKIKHPFGGRE